MATDIEIKKIRGQRLQAAREVTRLSVGEAAAAFGIGYSTYAAHENGTTPFPLPSAVQYAKKYKVSLDWLILGKGKGPGDFDEQLDTLLTLWPNLSKEEKQHLIDSAQLFSLRATAHAK